MFKLFSFKAGDTRRAGIAFGDRHYDLRQLMDDPPSDVDALLEQWDDWLPRLDALASAPPSGKRALDPASIAFLAPVRPGKVICSGGNYREHWKEMIGAAADGLNQRPYFFMKAPQCVIGPGEPIRLPKPEQARNVDWEGELAVVIGKRARDVARSEAEECIAGYTVFNDVTARDRVPRRDVPFSHDWFAGKSMETFGPLGPYLVPRQYVPDYNRLSIRTWVDDVLHQDGNTQDLIVKLPEMIEYLSALLTLYPRDVIATGTPAGVGAGKGVFLRSGQRVVVEVEGIGRLENPVV